jgi:nucleoside-diphosphate-sugar epimerase
MAAAVGDFTSRFTGKEPPITPEMAAAFSRPCYVASEKARRELGYRVVPLQTMVKDCYDWMLAEGRI